MREQELRENSECTMCGEKVGQTLLFYRITIERHVLNMQAISRQQGLTMMLGGHAELAQVMGADEEMTAELSDPVTAVLCPGCVQTTPVLDVVGKIEGEE